MSCFVPLGFMRLVYWHSCSRKIPGLYLLSGRTSYRKISKPRNSRLDFSKCPEIWQVSQQRCRDYCQISDRYDYYNAQSRGFQISRDPTVRRPSAKWIKVRDGDSRSRWRNYEACGKPASNQNKTQRCMNRLHISGYLAILVTSRLLKSVHKGAPLLTWFNLITAWKVITSIIKICVEITYPFPNFSRWMLGVDK